MGIFDNEVYLNPKYDFLNRYVDVMYKGFWSPAKYEKLIREIDVPQYETTMDPLNKEIVKKCILTVAMVEDKVKTYWPSIHKDLPQTIISDVGGIFGMSEVTHRRCYHSLVEMIKIDLKSIEKHKVLKGRLAYLNKYLEEDPKIVGKKRVLKRLILFTCLVERCSLFTQFYILMSYAKNNKGLKTISSLQQSTATEELFHYSFGIDLINVIKQEYPSIWDEYLVELLTENIKTAYKAELGIIDWFFENGEPEHISKLEVVNFLGYNFNQVAKDVGLDLKFAYNENYYSDKNEWMMLKLYSTNPDFFDNNVGGYSSVEEDINIDEFNF